MKILASDFDNTLYIKNENELNKNILALKKYLSKGNLFCIITGRSYTSVKELLNKYKIPYSYLICEDGAKLFNNLDYCIYTTLLNATEVEKVQKIFADNNIECLFEDGYNITENKSDCTKVIATYKDRTLADKIVKELHEKTNTYSYISTEHINVISNATNKEVGLKKLIELENLSSAELYVIGDDINDLEMLRTFNGAIMKKHHPLLSGLSKKEYEYLYEYLEELIND